MMFQLILIFGLLSNTENKPQQNYLDYHKRIIAAEEFTVQKKYEVALSELERIFNAYDFIFLRDYKIATQLSLLVGDESKALKYLKIGISKGWKLKGIKKNSFLKPILNTTEWIMMRSQYDSLRSKYLERINPHLRNRTQKLFKRDQKKAFGALLRLGDKAQEKYGEKKFVPHSELQIAELDRIMDKHGYPGERLIGNNFWASTILSHHNSSSKVYVMRDTLFQYLVPKLTAAVAKGEMSPYEFALISDWKAAVESDHNSSAYGFIGSISNPNLVNKNRQAIGLRSLELRNSLVNIEKETEMDLYLQGESWQKGKIEYFSQQRN